ncbi:hypothetical protein ACSD1O_004863 [Escherichia coli]
MIPVDTGVFGICLLDYVQLLLLFLTAFFRVWLFILRPAPCALRPGFIFAVVLQEGCSVMLIVLLKTSDRDTMLFRIILLRFYWLRGLNNS